MVSAYRFGIKSRMHGADSTPDGTGSRLAENWTASSQAALGGGLRILNRRRSLPMTVRRRPLLGTVVRLADRFETLQVPECACGESPARRVDWGIGTSIAPGG